VRGSRARSPQLDGRDEALGRFYVWLTNLRAPWELAGRRRGALTSWGAVLRRVGASAILALAMLTGVAVANPQSAAAAEERCGYATCTIYLNWAETLDGDRIVDQYMAVLDAGGFANDAAQAAGLGGAALSGAAGRIIAGTLAAGWAYGKYMQHVFSDATTNLKCIKIKTDRGWLPQERPPRFHTYVGDHCDAPVPTPTPIPCDPYAGPTPPVILPNLPTPATC
jgi:hypothetical protein